MSFALNFTPIDPSFAFHSQTQQTSTAYEDQSEYRGLPMISTRVSMELKPNHRSLGYNLSRSLRSRDAVRPNVKGINHDSKPISSQRRVPMPQYRTPATLSKTMRCRKVRHDDSESQTRCVRMELCPIPTTTRVVRKSRRYRPADDSSIAFPRRRR